MLALQESRCQVSSFCCLEVGDSQAVLLSFTPSAHASQEA